jgi:type VI protein secretion system component VasF
LPPRFAGFPDWLTRWGRANGKEDFRMPTWVWILLIVLLVVVLFGGVGYGRRGV